jgi:hypothetical protein
MRVRAQLIARHKLAEPAQCRGLRQLQEAEMAGLALGIAITPLDTRIPEGLEDAMARAAQAGAGAVLIISDSATISHRAQIGAADLRQRFAIMFAKKAYLTGRANELWSRNSRPPDLQTGLQWALAAET